MLLSWLISVAWSEKIDGRSAENNPDFLRHHHTTSVIHHINKHARAQILSTGDPTTQTPTDSSDIGSSEETGETSDEKKAKLSELAREEESIRTKIRELAREQYFKTIEDDQKVVEQEASPGLARVLAATRKEVYEFGVPVLSDHLEHELGRVQQEIAVQNGSAVPQTERELAKKVTDLDEREQKLEEKTTPGGFSSTFVLLSVVGGVVAVVVAGIAIKRQW